jgi:hypothetical protein
MKKTIEELLKNKMESELDTYPMVIENSVDDVLEVIMPVINAEIQKEREDAIKGYVKWAWNNGLSGLVDDDSVEEYLSQTKGDKK